MLAFMAFDHALFIFKGCSGMLGKGTATQCNWKRGKVCSMLATAALSSLDKIVRVASISIQPCSMSELFHVNWTELSVRAPSRSPPALLPSVRRRIEVRGEEKKIWGLPNLFWHKEMFSSVKGGGGGVPDWHFNRLSAGIAHFTSLHIRTVSCASALV